MLRLVPKSNPSSLSSGRVLIVLEDTMGMQHDTDVLIHALKNYDQDLDFYILTIAWDEFLNYNRVLPEEKELLDKAPFDIVFYFEHYYAHPPLNREGFSRHHVFVPNVEWIMAQDEAAISTRAPTAIIHKNAFSKNMCDQVPALQNALLSRVIGWTSNDPLQGAEVSSSKDPKRLLHVRGISSQKNTEKLVSLWATCDDLPHLTIMCGTHDGFTVPGVLHARPNLDIILGKVDNAIKLQYQISCGVHVYPSFLEGFGHSLNECRAVGSVLITSDNPPMSDFIIDGVNGFTVKSNSIPIRRSVGSDVDSQALYHAIMAASSMTREINLDMGRASRSMYLQDRDSFQENIAIFMNEIRFLK